MASVGLKTSGREKVTMPIRRGAGAGWLLPTKLTAPPPRPQEVRRQRLLDRLQEALRLPLTVITAPAGFREDHPAGGVARDRDRCSQVGVAWVSLDEGDNYRFASGATCSPR